MSIIAHMRIIMRKINLNAICTLMYCDGYNFASMSLSPQHESSNMEDGNKPDPAWYFYDVNWNNEDGHGEYSWAEFCKEENFEVDYYAAQPLCFAKFDYSKLISDNNDLPKYRGFREWYRWNNIQADGFHGVHVQNPYHIKWRAGGWDVPTVAIWNSNNCVSDVVKFENVGPWEYQYPGTQV